MEHQKSITTGKYEALALWLDDPEMVQRCLNTCIQETIRAGFDLKKATQIEHDNIRAYFQSLDDSRALKKISALLEKGSD